MNSKPRSAGDNDTFKSPGSKRDSARLIFIARVLLVLLLFSTLLPSPDSSAANRVPADVGDLVPTFGVNGVVKTDFAGGNDSALAVTVTLTGKIIAAGSATIPGKGTDFAVACYDGNGKLDPTFGQGGKATVDFFGANDGARGVVVQRDQKIVLSGVATNGSERQFALARFNPDGSLDPTFDQDGKVVLDLGSTSEAFKVALQADGKIVAVGDSRPLNSLDFTAVRLNPSNGSLDNSFGNNGVVRVDFGNADRAIDVAIDNNADGGIFVCGTVVKTATDSDMGIVRLNISNGSLNNAFDGDGKLTVDFFGRQDGAQAIGLRGSYIDVQEKHLLVGGFATLLNTPTQVQAIAPINYQGSLINNFFIEGQYEARPFRLNDTADQVFALFDEPDGGFGAAGWAGNGNSFDLGVAHWDYMPTTKRWGFSHSYTYDTSSGANNVAFDAVLYKDTTTTAGTGLNPATGNDDFILTQHENKKFAEIIKRAPATPVLRGDMITYTFEIKNLTDNDLSLLVTDPLPVGVTFEESQNAGWRVLPNFGRSLILERGPLSVPRGQTVFIALQVRADQSGILKNKANLLLPHPSDPIIGYITPTFLGSSEVESEVKESLEGDVAPRPGNGSNTIADWVQVGRFAAGLDAVNPGNEYQRADCAPRSSGGNGQLTVADWVQAGRYAAGLDPVASASGPTAPTSGSQQFSPDETAASLRSEAGQTRTLRALNASFIAGQTNTLDIELNALGGENAAAFSLNFAPSALSFVSAGAGSATTGAEIVVNTTQAASGRIGVALALPPGQGLQAGARRIATVQFNVVAGSSATTTPLGFGNQIVARQLANINADALTVSTTDAVVTIVRSVASVSAASFTGTALASESIVAAFGQSLATRVEAANILPLPTTLAGTTVKVKDSAGVERSAPLFFVAPAQVNFLVPPGTASGAAMITITSGNGAVSMGNVNIAAVTPGLFTANANGQGVAAAVALRFKADGTQSFEPVSRFDPALNRFVPVPIDLGPESDQVFLILFGTGWRFRSALSAVSLQLGGLNHEILYAGPQGDFAGLDQINARLLRSLIGRGDIEVRLTADGQTANIAGLSIK